MKKSYKDFVNNRYVRRIFLILIIFITIFHLAWILSVYNIEHNYQKTDIINEDLSTVINSEQDPILKDKLTEINKTVAFMKGVCFE